MTTRTEMCAAILAETPALTTKEIAAAIKEDTGTVADPDDLRREMARDKARFVVNRTERPHRWSLKETGQ